MPPVSWSSVHSVFHVHTPRAQVHCMLYGFHVTMSPMGAVCSAGLVCSIGSVCTGVSRISHFLWDECTLHVSWTLYTLPLSQAPCVLCVSWAKYASPVSWAACTLHAPWALCSLGHRTQEVCTLGNALFTSLSAASPLMCTGTSVT